MPSVNAWTSSVYRKASQNIADRFAFVSKDSYRRYPNGTALSFLCLLSYLNQLVPSSPGEQIT